MRALGIGLSHPAGKGEEVAVVGDGQLCRQQGSTPAGRFNHDDRIGQTGNDAVPAEEIFAVDNGITQEIAHHATVFLTHFEGNGCVERRVNSFESVGQNANGAQIVVQCRPVCLDIYPVGQSADDLDIVTPFGHRYDEFVHQFTAILRGISGSDNAEHLGAIQVGFPFGIEQDGGIDTGFQPLGVTIIQVEVSCHAVALDKVYLLFGPDQHTGLKDVFGQYRSNTGNCPEYLLLLPEYPTGAAAVGNQRFCRDAADARDQGDGDFVEKLFLRRIDVGHT